jgi:hypothetical protein
MRILPQTPGAFRRLAKKHGKGAETSVSFARLEWGSLVLWKDTFVNLLISLSNSTAKFALNFPNYLIPLDIS